MSVYWNSKTWTTRDLGDKSGSRVERLARMGFRLGGSLFAFALLGSAVGGQASLSADLGGSRPEAVSKGSYTASVKPVDLPTMQAQMLNPSLRVHPAMDGDRGRLHIMMDLKDIILYAYNIADSQLDNATQDVVVKWFDITIVAEAPVGNDLLRSYLQDVLKTRFHMLASLENLNTEVFALVVAPGGPRFPALAEDAPAPTPQGPEFVSTDVQRLVKWLNTLRSGPDTRGVILPVIDRTGLTGRYSIKLRIIAAATSCDGCMVYPVGSSIDIPALVRAQLGLDFRREAGSITHLHVQAIGAPTPD